MKSTILTSIRVFLLLTLLTGVLYPVGIWGVSHLVLPWQSEGSQILRNNGVAGSVLIGQNFTSPQYFQGRPSATSERPYNAMASGGSNFGPSNPDLKDSLRARSQVLCMKDSCNQTSPPQQLLQASASGLDPHISPAAAIFQVERIAKSRNMDPAKLLALIDAKEENRLWGIFGEPRVNVLLLNLELDQIVNTEK